jgi:two-component system KDP operon response regulator KdpE
LAARLRAVLCRVIAEDGPAETVIPAGTLEVDLERRLCRKAGNELHLSPTEFDVLALLVRHRVDCKQPKSDVLETHTDEFVELR